MVISSGHIDDKDRLFLFIMCILTGVGILYFCLPPVIEFDFHATSFWIPLVLALIVIPTLSFTALSILFKSQSVVLLSSKQPILVTTTTWFGKYASTVEDRLDGAAWVQVSCNMPLDDNGSYAVEIVQPERWATKVCSYELSNEGLELAKKRCTEIAGFLEVEDIGYRG